MCVPVLACARSRPRVPCAGPRSCVLAPRGHPRVRPGAPGGKTRSAHGRGWWTHRPTRCREEGGGGGGGERGHVTETDWRAGRREAVAAGSSRRRSPANASPSPRSGKPPPSPGAADRQFPVPESWLGGAFPGGFWKQEGTRGGGPKRGERGRRAGRGLPAGSGRGGAGRRWDRAAAPSRTCCRPGAGVPASAARPSIVAAAGEGGRGGPSGIPSCLPRAGARRGLDPPGGEALRSPRRGRPRCGEGRRGAPEGRGRTMRGVGTSGRLTPDRPEARRQGGGELCSWGRGARGDLANAGLVEAPSQRARWLGRAPRPSSWARGPARTLRRPTPAGALLGPGCGHGGAAAASSRSLPVCQYRRWLQGVYWGQGLRTGTRPPKLALKRKNGPESPAGESF